MPTLAAMKAALLCLLTSAAAANAQEGAPRPSAEHARLNYFVGKWQVEGEIKPGPMGPGGKMSNVEVCDWYHGGFNLVCNVEGTGPWSPTRSLRITGFDPATRAYTFYEISNLPRAQTSVPKGSVDGSVWTYRDEQTVGGRQFSLRFTITELPPSQYTFKAETIGPDGNWLTMFDASATRVP